jgi:hypothetical protein
MMRYDLEQMQAKFRATINALPQLEASDPLFKEHFEVLRAATIADDCLSIAMIGLDTRINPIIDRVLVRPKILELAALKLTKGQS